MSKTQAPIRVSFGDPFDDAINDVRRRLPVLPDRFYGRAQDEARRNAFTVSRLASVEQVKEVQDSIAEAMRQGKSLNEWRAWALQQDWGLSSGHLSTIYRTNVQTAYMAGHWENFQEHKDTRPYLMYSAINDSRVRPNHLKMNGYIAPVDAKIWQEWYPTNGLNCRCSAISLSESEAMKRGYGKQDYPNVKPDPGFGSHSADHDENLRSILDNKLSGMPVSVAAAVRESMNLSPEIVEDGVKSALGQALWDKHVDGISVMLERAALYEQVAFRAYTGEIVGEEINKALRGLSEHMDTLRPMAIAIDSFLKKAPIYTGEVYRGIVKDGFRAIDSFLDAHQVGAVVQYNAFTSASLVEAGARQGEIMLTIISRTGRDVGQYSAFPLEKEALFGSKTKFKVISRGAGSDGIIRITLEEIADQTIAIPVSHIFDALPDAAKAYISAIKTGPETEDERRWKRKCMSQVMSDEDKKYFEAFIEEHGMTPMEVVEFSYPDFYKPSPKRIAEYIREYGEHPEIYVARVFKKQQKPIPWDELARKSGTSSA